FLDCGFRDSDGVVAGALPRNHHKDITAKCPETFTSDSKMIATLPLQTASLRRERKHSLHHELEAFNEFGTATSTEGKTDDARFIEAQVPVYLNEFWTSKQRAANRLHEISYRACFKPQLPRFFIERLTKPGDRVFDPFM